MRPVQVFSKPCSIALRRLDAVGMEVCHVYTVPVLVWLSVPEFYLPQSLIVVSTRELPTFMFACSWLLLLFVFHFFGLTFIACIL